MMDLAVQGAEFELLPPLIDVLDARVRRLIVGTRGGGAPHAAGALSRAQPDGGVALSVPRLHSRKSDVTKEHTSFFVA